MPATHAGKPKNPCTLNLSEAVKLVFRDMQSTPVVSLRQGTPDLLAAGMANGTVSILDFRSGQVASDTTRSLLLPAHQVVNEIDACLRLLS